MKKKTWNQIAQWHEYEDGTPVNPIDREFTEMTKQPLELNTVNCHICGFCHLARWNCVEKKMMRGIPSFKDETRTACPSCGWLYLHQEDCKWDEKDNNIGHQR